MVPVVRVVLVMPMMVVVTPVMIVRGGVVVLVVGVPVMVRMPRPLPSPPTKMACPKSVGTSHGLGGGVEGTDRDVGT